MEKGHKLFHLLQILGRMLWPFPQKYIVFLITNLDGVIDEPTKHQDNTTSIKRKNPTTMEKRKTKVAAHSSKSDTTPIDLTRPTPDKKNNTTKSRIVLVCRGLFIKNTHPKDAIQTTLQHFGKAIVWRSKDKEKTKVTGTSMDGRGL